MTQDAGQLPSHTGREPTLGALDNDPVQPIASRLRSTNLRTSPGWITAAPTSSCFSWEIGNQAFLIGDLLDGA